MSGTTEPTEAEVAAAAAAEQQASGGTVATDTPPVRPRRQPPPMGEAMAETQVQMDAADTSTLTELERTSMEVHIGVERRVADEAAQAQYAEAASALMEEEAAKQQEYEKALAEYKDRQAAVAAATTDAPVDTPEGMTRLKIVQNVSVVRDDGTLATYTVTGTNCGIPGTWDMPTADAEHWYVQYATENPPPSLPPQPGTPAATSIAMRVQAARAQAELVLEQQALQAAEEVRQQNVAAVQAAMGDSFQQSPPVEQQAPPSPPVV